MVYAKYYLNGGERKEINSPNLHITNIKATYTALKPQYYAPISGKKVSEAADVTAAVQKKSVGDKIKITISRDGSSKTVIVTLKEATKNNSSISNANASDNSNGGNDKL